MKYCQHHVTMSVRRIGPFFKFAESYFTLESFTFWYPENQRCGREILAASLRSSSRRNRITWDAERNSHAENRFPCPATFISKKAIHSMTPSTEKCSCLPSPRRSVTTKRRFPLLSPSFRTPSKHRRGRTAASARRSTAPSRTVPAASHD